MSMFSRWKWTRLAAFRGCPIGVLRFVAVLALGLSASLVGAQQYPSKPVRIVVPAPPGGLSDVVARALAVHLQERLGQPFVVDNRSGASGVIGSDYVAKSAPDGYTLLVFPSIFVITPLLVKSVPYDVLKDFTPVSLIGTVPLVLVVHSNVQAANLREFIANAKANPDKNAFGASGLGSVGHLTTERLRQEAGLKGLLVPYKGAAPAVLDLIGGRITAMIDPIPVFIEHIKAGKLKPLGVTTRERVNMLPEVPTLAESGLAGFEERSWYGFWGPARMPREAVNVLNREIAEAMKSPRMTERLTAQGMVPAGSRPEEFEAFMNAEVEKYRRLIRDANIKVEN